MNSITYLSREFRDKLSEAFQHVIAGKRVFIKRFGRTFELTEKGKIERTIKQLERLERRVGRLEQVNDLATPTPLGNLDVANPPSEGSDSKELDDIVLDLVHQGSLMQRGKTINAAMFPEVIKSLTSYTNRKVIEELESLGRIYEGQVKASVMLDLKDRITSLKREAGE